MKKAKLVIKDMMPESVKLNFRQNLNKGDVFGGLGMEMEPKTEL